MASVTYWTQGEMGIKRVGLHHRHIHWEMPSANGAKGAPGAMQKKRLGLIRHALTFSAASIVRNPQAVASEVSTREQEVTYFLGINFCYLDITKLWSGQLKWVCEVNSLASHVFTNTFVTSWGYPCHLETWDAYKGNCLLVWMSLFS